MKEPSRQLIQRVLGLQEGFSADPAEHAIYFTRALLVPSALIIAAHLILRRFSTYPVWMTSDSLLLGLFAWCIISLVLLRTSWAHGVSIVTVILVWAVAAINCWLGQGVRDAAILLMPAAFMICGLVAGARLTLSLTGLTIAVIWLLAVSERTGSHHFQPSNALDNGRDLTIIVIVMAVIILLYGRGLRLSRKRILTELAERNRAEEDRQKMLVCEQEARTSAEQANLAKDRFIATVSHELRTPLTPVVMSLSALEADPALSRELRHEAGVMRQNIEIELRLISDLLDMSRARFGKLSLVRRPCHINDVLREVIAVCQQDIRVERIHVESDLSTANPEISGDPDRLRQVYWNLLRNAVKFTPPDGRITVRSSVLDVNRQPIVRVEVIDTGCGIEPDLMPRLFQLFEQGESPTSRRAGGMGIGLAISRTIIAEHGGQISASSPGKDKGATFITDLPCALAPSAPTEASPEPAKTALRILMVEDDVLTALTFDRILRTLGHQPVHASSLSAARDALARDGFDLLVSDISLPDGTGLEIMPLFARTCGRPGIALSGYGTEMDVAASLAAGYFTHLIKPVSMQQLARAISAATAISAERTSHALPAPPQSDSTPTPAS